MSTATHHQQAVERAITAMTADLTIDVATMAHAAGYTTFYFSRLFLASTGLTPAQYRAKLRMERACQLLVGTHLSVADIASRVGYQSVGAFPARFRMHFGCSPTAYRKGER